MMKYTLLTVALAALILTACNEGRKTPDGYEMDNPPPSAYAPSDFETFEPDLYEPVAEPATDDADVTDTEETNEVEEIEIINEEEIDDTNDE